MNGFVALLVLNIIIVAKTDVPLECSEGVVSNDHAFGIDPTECGAFFECVLIKNDDLLQTEDFYEIHRKHCGFGLFWSNTLLTCVLPGNVTDVPYMGCNDPCTQLPKGKRRPMSGNCGGFWVCNDRISIGVCCPRNQLYNESTESCIEDKKGICNNTDCSPPLANITGCNASCIEVYGMWGKHMTSSGIRARVLTPLGQTTYTCCSMREFPEDNTKYIEETHHTAIVRSCPKGTIFESCGCIYDYDFDPRVVAINECEPLFVLDFDENDLSQPGIEFARVRIQSDVGNSTKTPGPSGKYGHFNGTAFVLIYSLANRHSTNIRVINFMMRSVVLGEGLPQTVVTNSINAGRTCRGFDCLGSIQIDIIQKNELLHYLVSTEDYHEIQTPINDDWISVWWVFIGQKVGLFGAKSLNRENTQMVHGQLAERRTPLVIGRPPTPLYGHHFTGDIDNFKVYNCIPKEAPESLTFLKKLQ